MKRQPHIPESAWKFLVNLSHHRSVEALILFGSRAVGDHEEGSDVDVAVCGESITRLEWARIRDAAYTAKSLYWISLVHFDRNPAALQRRIAQTGVKIYVRSKADGQPWKLNQGSRESRERAVQIPKDRELVAEGTIQRFEITIELFWKTLQRVIRYEGTKVKTPRESLKEAFRLGWLQNEQVWLDMLDSRNTTSHQYLDEELADNNYEDIKKITPILRAAFDLLNARYVKTV